MTMVSLSTFQRLLIVIVCILGIYFLVNYFYDILLPFFISAILAYLISPLIDVISNRLHIKRIHAISLFFVLFFALILVVIVTVIPKTINSVSAFQQNLPRYTKMVKNTYTDLEKAYPKQMAMIKDKNIIEKIEGYVTTYASNLVSNLPNMVSQIFSIVSILAVLPFITFFYLLDAHKLKRFIYELIPNKYFELYINLTFRFNKQLSGYVSGQFLEASVVGVLSFLGLWLLHVNYFWAIGAFAGLANLIPYVGPVAGAIPAILISVFQYGSLNLILPIIILFALIQFIDNMFVQPLVLGKSVDMHPLLIMFAVIVGGKIGGVLGMLLAVPIATMTQVAIASIYEEIKFWREFQKKQRLG